MAYGFPPREGYKITSEPIEYEKHVIYDIQAIKDVPYRNVVLRLRQINCDDITDY